MIPSLIVMVVALLAFIGELCWFEYRWHKDDERREAEHPGSYIPWRDLREVDLTSRGRSGG